MSTGAILTVLSNIPWGQVVENAPKVAEGAAKLWNTVTSFRKSSASGQQAGDKISQKAPSETEALRSQLQALEETVRNLQDQMQASSELIKALADQNTQLVQRIELNRVRLQRVSLAAAASGFLLFAAIVYLVLRQ
jgi:predicted  nucleic acid-binding Zn-ribbon protein